MTVTKSTMYQAMQRIMSAFHLSGFSDENVIEVGKMLQLESDNEWIDTQNLLMESYNREHLKDADRQGSHQW